MITKIMMIVDFWHFLIEKDRLVSRPFPPNAQLTQKTVDLDKTDFSKELFPLSVAFKILALTKILLCLVFHYFG